MSADRFSIGEFDDYLDDIEGHRLAQFLQKKTGKEPLARPVFDYEPERFSLNVRVKRVSTPLNIQGRQEGDELIASPLTLRGKENLNVETVVAEHEPHANPTSVPPSIGRVNKEENEKKTGAVSKPEAPVEALKIVSSPLAHSQQMRIPSKCLSLHPLTPAQRRGDCGTRDQLHCISPRRLLLADERRMLPKDSESIQSTPDFAPLVFSTPLSRQQLKSPVASESQRADPADGDMVHAVGVTFTNAAAGNSLLLSESSRPRGKDKDLCEKLADVLETTIQKLHEKEDNKNVRAGVFDRLYWTSPQDLEELMDVNNEIPDRCGKAVSLQRVNTEVQEELLQEAQRLVKSLNSTKVQVPEAVLPVEPTFNGVSPTQLSRQLLAHDTAEKHSKEPDAANLPKQDALRQKGEKQTPSSPPCSEKPASPRLHCEKLQVKSIAENATIDKNSIMARIQRHNSSLAEIITEDEDDDADKPNLTIASSGRKSGPLDLATVRSASGTPLLHSRRLRRLAGSHHRRDPFDLRRPQAANQKEAAGKRPLNKAPSVPINGEKFADELKAHLARLTNYEILDLRKRNSHGDVYRISDRRHSLEAKKQAMEQQLQLEEQIQMEILRRNLEDNGDELANIQEEQQVQPQGDEMAIVHENIFSELPPVPGNFRDSSTWKLTNLEVEIVMPPRNDELLLQIPANAGHCSSLVAERSSDRISFVQPSSNLSQPIRSSRRRKYKNKMPEMVQKYLGVRDKVVKHRPLNQTRRSLYSKGYSDLEPEENEYISLTPAPPTTSPIVLPRVPSPPTTSPIVSPRVPSPPPPISGNFNVKLCQEVLPPPVPFMNAHTGSTAVNIESKDAVFKKPLLPATRMLKKRKRKDTTETSVQMDASEVSLLRRSKRERVPVDNTLVHSLFQRLSLTPAPPTTSPIVLPRVPSPPPPTTSTIVSPRVPSPPPPTMSPIVSPRVPSPPPPISGNFNAKLCQEILPPPVPFMNAHTGSTAVNIESKDAVFKKPLLPAPRILKKGKRKETTETSVQMDASEEPLLRRSKRQPMPVDNSFLHSLFQRLNRSTAEQSKQRRKRVFVRHDESTTPLASSTPISHLGAASHSRKQGKKPRKTQFSTESDLYLSGDTDAICQTTASLKNRRVPTSVKHQRRELTPILEPLVELEAVDIVDVPATSPKVKKTSKRSKKHVPVVRGKVAGIAKVDNGTNSLEHSHIQIPPAPVNELNDIFDQLKHAGLRSRDASPMALSSCTVTTRRTRNVRVRLQRLKFPSSSIPLPVTTNNANCHESRAVNSCPSVSSSSNSQSVAINKAKDRVPLAATNPVTETAPNSTVDLLSWLKGLCQTQMTTGHEQMFMDMHFSPACDLAFTDLEGIDFAFYDTDEKASLGYLRFKPRQKKPAKIARKYHLHFIVLAGEFDIGTDHEHRTFTIGDMVAISIGRRYTIENIRDDVGLLMVIKK